MYDTINKIAVNRNCTHLWLDIWCYNNNLDPGWQKRKMGALYESAELCIILSSAVKPELGTWNERLWTLQEELMSREIVVLGSDGELWQYKQLECQQLSATKAVVGTMNIFELWPLASKRKATKDSDFPIVLGLLAHTGARVIAAAAVKKDVDSKTLNTVATLVRDFQKYQGLSTGQGILDFGIQIGTGLAVMGLEWWLHEQEYFNTVQIQAHMLADLRSILIQNQQCPAWLFSLPPANPVLNIGSWVPQIIRLDPVVVKQATLMYDIISGCMVIGVINNAGINISNTKVVASGSKWHVIGDVCLHETDKVIVYQLADIGIEKIN